MDRAKSLLNSIIKMLSAHKEEAEEDGFTVLDAWESEILLDTILEFINATGNSDAKRQLEQSEDMLQHESLGPDELEKELMFWKTIKI